MGVHNMYFSIIENNIVIDTLVAESLEIAKEVVGIDKTIIECYSFTEPGDIYNGKDFEKIL
jgi:hypothetical protein